MAKKRKQEKSCGAILFKMAGETRLYLTVEYKIEAGYWGLVKGHIEKGESEKETAAREIYEEVGLSNLRFVEGFRTCIYYSPRPKVDKEVVFFLAEVVEGEVEYIFDEMVAHLWLPYEATLAKLKHDGDRAVLQQAEAFLRPDPS